MESKFFNFPILQRQPTLASGSRPKSPKQVMPRRANTLLTQLIPKSEKRLQPLKLPPLESQDNSSSMPSLPSLPSPKLSNKSHGKVLAYAGCTFKGKRDKNEDRVVMFKTSSQSTGEKISYFGIFDGFSGTHVANYLRDNLHKRILAHQDIEKNTGKAIQEGFAMVESELMAQDSKLVYKCGACANVSVVIGKFVFTANLGSCKSFLSSVKGFEKNEVSEEHSAGNLKERQRVEAEGDEIVEVQGRMRVKTGMLNVTRCFGCFMAKGKGVSAVPDIKMARIKKEMDFLIMTSDGVWEVLNKTQLIYSVWSSIDKTSGNILKKLSSAIQDLMRQAIEAGSMDNLSIIIIAFPNLNLYI